MRYADLIQFEPIESVVQLREANERGDAKRLVETFVISDRMGEILTDLVFPQLQFLKPADNKGVLVVGNYGTGKSHLMAVISAVAEHEKLAPLLTNPAVADAAGQIAGRFRVIRSEIGATTMSLRDIVVRVLEDGLRDLGVAFDFPLTNERHENKSAFREMMAAFQQVFPEQGLLLVLDELLDFLRSRRDQELNLDLSFLREVGEVCKGTRFRFMAGVQESLFDNPRFQFVADTLRRVKDRFDQVRIAREDVTYVVSERLLKKDAKQQAMVREHLTRFASCYGTMNERMDEFVRLFPVHPAYLDTFERVYVAEKREVLRTLSATMRRLIELPVPDAEPGLIAYDSYWQVLRDNPSFRAVNEIKEVIDKSGILEARIQQAFTRPQYRPAAIRIIHALSVHRLTTTGDIFSRLGPTAEELRDDLCLLLPVPERDADFLKTMVETVLKEIVKTVSGQFISFTPDNGQYFLDLKKDIDFDSLIERKAEGLDNGQLDRYYFDALRRVVMEDPEAPPYVSGYRIWEHEVEWRERKAGRSGYLFFGAPNERSTAQPPRDFYVYFLQPFDPPYFKDEGKPDEVFFTLKQRDDALERVLELYAAARELWNTASGSNKKVYEDKALEHLKGLTAWLRDHVTTAFEAGYQGRGRSLAEVIQGKAAAGAGRATVRDHINAAASILLAPEFQDKSPDYPIFSILVTRQNRDQAAQEALRWIAGGLKSKQGAAVLDALELLQGDLLRPRDSRYGKHVIELLDQKGQGQVLNRVELVQSENGIDYWTRFRLEPEFLGVVLAALVHSGDVVMSLPGKKIDAAALEQLAKLPIGDVREFKHVERPKDLPLGPLQDLCDLLGVPKGLIVNPATRDEAVSRIQQKVAEQLNRAVTAASRVSDLVLWGKPILSATEQGEWRTRLADLKSFFESLQPFNSPGKLKNFPHDSAAVAARRPQLDLVREVDELFDLVRQLSPTTSYLGKAEAVLDSAHPWVASVREKQAELLARIASPKHRADPGFQRTLGQTLSDLKTAYQDVYLAAHTYSRLGTNDDKTKGALTKDPRLDQLRRLSGIEMMPGHQLREFENALLSLKTCFSVTRQEVDADPVCPHCGFRPVEKPAGPVSAGEVLRSLDERLDGLVDGWTRTLVNNLTDPTVGGNIGLVSDPKGRKAIAALLEQKAIPDPVPNHLVQALQEVLSGLQKVVLHPEDLQAALARGGTPCTLAELWERFERHLGELAKGKDASKVRVVVE